MYLFYADPEIMLEFFKRAKEGNIVDEAERVKILLDMIREGYNISVSQSQKTPEQWVKDYSKHGKVLWVKPKTLEGGVEDGTSED